jgi:GNAT superfamily N-acetyltransferase
MPDVHYRLATIIDIDALVGLRVAMQSEVGDYPKEHWLQLGASLREYFSAAIPAGEFIAWVAEVEGKVIATSGMCFRQHPPNRWNLTGHEAYIMNMYTVPEFRGRGFAGVLLEKLIQIARERNYPRIVLHAQTKAKPIYARAGFVDNDTEMRLDLRTKGA